MNFVYPHYIKTADVALEGDAICLAKIKGSSLKHVIKTMIRVKAQKQSEMQHIGDYYTSMDFCSADYDTAEAIYPDDYVIFTLKGEVKQGVEPITEILEVLDDNIEDND